MRFWDTSAVIPLISGESISDVVGDLLLEDREISLWWRTWVERAIAISRLKREGNLDEKSEGDARVALDGHAADWTEIESTDGIRLTAAIVSQDHPLKTADALQLAAALRWCEGDTNGAGLVCLDNRLRLVARDEGFAVLPEAPVG